MTHLCGQITYQLDMQAVAFVSPSHIDLPAPRMLGTASAWNLGEPSPQAGSGQPR